MRYTAEALERRLLLATHVINGNPFGDQWFLEADAGQLVINGTPVVDPSITDVQVNGFDGDDSLFINHATIPVVFNGGNHNDLMFAGTGLLSNEVPTTLTFNGGSGIDVGEGRNDNYATPTIYAFSGASFGWGSGAINYDSAVEQMDVFTGPADSTVYVTSTAFLTTAIVVIGSTGSDYVSVDSSPGIVSVVGGGGAGVDHLLFDDSASSADEYTISTGSIVRSDRTVNHSGLESIDFRGSTTSAAQYFISGSSALNDFQVSSGNASDTFTITASEHQKMWINAGSGGLDTISFNDSLHSQPLPRADFDATLIKRYRGADPFDATTYDLHYNNTEAWTYTARNTTTSLNVYGTPSSIPSGQQATIFCGSNADQITVYPHDQSGNLTVNGNIGIVGGGGTDQFTVDDTFSPNGINYVISNPFGPGTQNILGMGIGALGTAGVENLTIFGGTGQDLFDVQQYKSGTNLAMYGGPGFDDVRIAQGSQSLDGSITSIGSFYYDGQGGDDHFKVFNQFGAGGGWQYRRDDTFIKAREGAYSLTLTHINCGYTFIGAGNNVDQFNVVSTPFNSNTELFGGGGDDLYVIGQSGEATPPPGFTSGILGTVSCGRDGIGADRVHVRATAETAGRIVHITPDFIGNSLDDTLFGSTDGVIDISDITGRVQVELGSGADTVYAQPGGAAPVYIHGNNPAASPGDVLAVATAALTNPVYNDLGGGSGNFTYVGSNGFEFTGFESVLTDNVPPTMLSQEFVLTPGGPAMQAVFSEDVSNSIYYNQMSLLLQGTVFGGIDGDSLSYDAGTNTATWLYANLPSGSYYAHYDWNDTRDQYGNAMTGPPAAYNFTWADGTGGPDEFRVARDPGTSEYQVYVNNNAAPAFVGVPGTDKVVLRGGGDDDVLGLDSTDGAAIPANQGVDFDAGAGAADAVEVIASVAADNVSYGNGTITLNGAVFSYNDAELFSYDGNGGDDGLTINAGNLSIPTSQKFSSVAIADGASVVLATGGDIVLQTANLDIGPTGLLDIADNDVIVDYAGASPAGLIEADVASAYNTTGDWLGYGITSSIAQVDGNYVVGIADNAVLAAPFGTGQGGPLFGGVDVDLDAVLIKFTHRADINLDGLVTPDDSAIFGGNYDENQFARWSTGDLNFDGLFTPDDAAIFGGAYDESLPPV